jgi:integrase
MPKKKLSAIAILSLRGGRHHDHVIPGLEITVGKNRRTWTYRYRIGGRNPRQKLGYFPSMGLQAARDAARKLIDRLESGAAPQPAPVHPRSALTLRGLIDRYEALRQVEGHRTKTLAASMAMLRQQLRPYLSIPATQFSKIELRAARDVLVEAGSLTAANRLLGYLGPVLRWGAQEDLIATNFVPDIRKSPERKRSRVLTDQELAAIWRACDRLGGGASAKAFGRLVRFLAVTAQRKSEGASLRHGDILGGRWKQATNKAERPHSLALPPLALQLIGTGEASSLVFAGVNGKLGGFSKFKKALDKSAGVMGWRLHDLRRTAATHMQELGVRNEIIQAVLNHAVPGVGGVYLRAELEKEKAEALRTWATEIERIVGKRRAVS